MLRSAVGLRMTDGLHRQKIGAMSRDAGMARDATGAKSLAKVRGGNQPPRALAKRVTASLGRDRLNRHY